MSSAIHSLPDDVDSRLSDLGLQESWLTEAAKVGFAAYANQSPLSPPNYPGTAAWGETFTALAGIAIPHGWKRVDDGGMAFVVRDDDAVALVVWTGNEQTGNPHRQPKVRSRRGSGTVLRVSSNVRQLRLASVEPLAIEATREGEPVTWAFLIYRDLRMRVLRSELSLPVSMSQKKIDGWDERILLPAIPFDDDGFEESHNDQPDGPDVNIPIVRRA